MINRLLILGASGMLGSALLRYFSKVNDCTVFGAARSHKAVDYFSTDLADCLILGHDLCNSDDLIELFDKVKPNLVINCVGVVKQHEDINDSLTTIHINSLLPHRLAYLCNISGARLIHISTDCVFSGDDGFYKETDVPDATDLYGRSKLLGEVSYPNAITLRTSLIGHELDGSRSLINWFLKQDGKVNGYTKALFSGMPTIEVARIIETFVIPSKKLEGVYHLSVDPISKYELLSLVRDVYAKHVEIVPDDSVVIDRSLDSTRFRRATGFVPKSWLELVQTMHDCR